MEIKKRRKRERYKEKEGEGNRRVGKKEGKR
jgi:hypothetical protein